MLRILSCLFLLSVSFYSMELQAQNKGYEISVHLKNYDQKESYLAGYIGDTPYILDTVSINEQRWTFSNEEPLQDGVYLIVLPPDNRFIQLFIEKGNQHFSVEGDYDQLDKQSFTIKNSPSNQLFYEYTDFLSQKAPMANQLREAIGKARKEGKPADKEIAELEKVNLEVKEYQQNLVKQHPDSPVSTWIKFGFEPDIPEFEGTPEEIQLKKYHYRKKHFFDYIDFSDTTLYRNPMLAKKVDYYMNQLTVPMADSLKPAIDLILSKVKPVPKLFRFYLGNFLNEYAEKTQKMLGMDAVYVHLVDNYYSKGLAPWIEEEALGKIEEEAHRRRPTLMGRKAMNIKMRKEDGTTISLYDIESPYTVLYFWRFDCSHCKKSTPHVVDFYEKFKDRGVKVMGTCVKLKEKDMEECWKYVHDKEMDKFINVVDPGNRSKFTAKFDTRTTPRIFILDKDKKIIINKIGAEQLSEIMEQIILDDQKKLEESLKTN